MHLACLLKSRFHIRPAVGHNSKHLLTREAHTIEHLVEDPGNVLCSVGHVQLYEVESEGVNALGGSVPHVSGDSKEGVHHSFRSRDVGS